MADVTVYSVKGQSQAESLGIMTGAGGAVFCKVNEDASSTSDATPTAGSINDGGGDTAYCTFAFANRGAIRAITVLTADGDGDNVTVLLSPDTDVHDNILTAIIPVGTTIYGRWSSQLFSLHEGNSVMLYFENTVQ